MPNLALLDTLGLGPSFFKNLLQYLETVRVTPVSAFCLKKKSQDLAPLGQHSYVCHTWQDWVVAVPICIHLPPSPLYSFTLSYMHFCLLFLQELGLDQNSQPFSLWLMMLVINRGEVAGDS